MEKEEKKVFVDILGSVITAYRKSFNSELSSRAFAERCGISKSVVRQLENGEHNGNISYLTLEKIATGMGINYDELNERIKNYNGNNIDYTIKTANLKIYHLFELIQSKKLNDESIEMLHNIVSKIQ